MRKNDLGLVSAYLAVIVVVGLLLGVAAVALL